QVGAIAADGARCREPRRRARRRRAGTAAATAGRRAAPTAVRTEGDRDVLVWRLCVQTDGVVVRVSVLAVAGGVDAVHPRAARRGPSAFVTGCGGAEGAPAAELVGV